MNLFGSYSFTGEAIVRALGWSLLHSLWQGILLSFVAGVIMLLTKKVKSSLRYNLLVGSIILFVLSVLVTFINQLDVNILIKESILAQTLSNERVEFSGNLVMNRVQSSAIIQTINFINTNAIWIVSIWLLVIVIKFIKLSSGFYYIYQLKHKQVSPATQYWDKRISELCKQLKINKKVVLLQSGIVTIPSVIGYFKPIILFPAAMLTAIPVHEVEAILIHELGHIRRNDFVVNMLQNIVEVVFFFNPAVQWVSSLIKTERENCCDDIAVNFMGYKQDYIKALINFLQFEQQETNQMAIAFSGEKNHLLNRAKRIVYNKNNTLNIMEKKFLSASFVLVSICFLAFISMKAQDNKLAKTLIHIPIKSNEGRKDEAMTVGKQDTIPIYKIGGKGNLTGETNTFIDGKAYRIVIKNSVVTEMYIDRQKIPTEKIIDYKTLLDKQFAEMIKNREKAIRESEKAVRESDASVRDSERAIIASEKALKESDASVRDSERVIIESEQAMKESEKAMKETEKAMKESEAAMKHSEAAMKDSEQTNRRMNDVIDELIANKIINNREELYSLKLNAKKLVVNGVKQATNLHEKLKNRFDIRNNQTLDYYESR